MRALRITFTLTALCCIPTLALCQGGCVNSPENPTLILALVGGAAAACSALHSKLRRKQ
jgi:XrtJ-associated TM-motif-TM protein